MSAFRMMTAVLVALAAACSFGRQRPMPYDHRLVVRPEPRNLPELLKTKDGTRVTTAAAWEEKARPEILRFFTENVYGVRPVERPEKMRFVKACPDSRTAVPDAVRKITDIEYAGPHGKGRIRVTAFIPETTRPVPAFLLVCNRDPAANVDPERKLRTEFFPVEEITWRGYAAIAFHTEEACPDDWQCPFTNGVIGAFGPRPAERTERSWGAISAWAWAASRVMDWIETEPLVDARHVAVIGHSRGGKTSLWAGASDPRFALVCVNDSGAGGAKLNHADIPYAENIDHITRINPTWFASAYAAFRGEDRFLMPYDQHQLAALVAPRLLAIGSADEDPHSGPWGEFLTAKLASPAWALYGKGGIPSDAVLPYPGEPMHAGCVSYHLRRGKHDLNLQDWTWYMNFADKNGFKECE